MKVLLTGANGFLGSSILDKLEYLEVDTVALVRKNMSRSSQFIYFYQVDDLFLKDLSFCKGEVPEVFIHCAALAHIKGVDESKFKKVNTDLTVQLAELAAKSGCKRFVFISSIGVNGVANTVPFKFSDEPNPTDSYSISKYKAEIKLKEIAKASGMEVVIIRPPLIYGKGAPGNFGTLLKLAKKNLPLPLGAINNDRSFVSIDNLIDLIITCIDHPGAANQIFLVSDDEDISTSNLLKKLTLAAEKKPWLLPVPVSLLKLLAAMVGKKAVVERFSSSLTVDIENTKKTLNWKPPITLDEGIRRCFK